MQNYTEKRIDIPLDKIEANPQNLRTMEAIDIEYLAESILNIGCIQPPVVYRNEKGNYTLLSGHRRMAAIKEINRMFADGEKLPEGAVIKEPITSVTCIVVDKPKDIFEEQEILAQGNIHRYKPSEIQDEVKLIIENWNSLDDKVRKAYGATFKERFIRKHRTDAQYLDDPKKYLSDNFRPIYEYVRVMTGMEVSNYIVKKVASDMLKGRDKLPEDREPEKETPTPAAKEKETGAESTSGEQTSFKKLTLKKAANKCVNLMGELQFLDYDGDTMAEDLFGDLFRVMDNIIEYIGA